MTRLITNVFCDDQGQDLIEYGLLISIITLAAIVSIKAIGGKVAGYYTALDAALP